MADKPTFDAMTGALRTLAIGLFAVGLVLALVGTGGFSSATADRGVTVATAPDESAYVGYDSPDEIVIDFGGEAENGSAANGSAENESVENGSTANGSAANGSETVALVTLTNRFSAEVDVTEVEIDEKPDDLAVTVRPPPSDVSPGESASLVAEIECEDAFEAEPLSVTVHLRGENVEAVVFGDTERRTASVTCRAGS